MKLNILIAVIIASFVSVLSTATAADDDMVNGYINSSGSVVMTGYGECWRTSYHDSTDKNEACGYKKPVPVVENPEPVVKKSPKP